MFIIDPELNTEMKVMLRAIKIKLGKVPPHWKLYAGINPIRFKMFMDEINYLSSHKRINPDFFTFLRYATACKHGFGYCEKFNHDYLISLGYTPKQLEAVAVSADALPLDERHRALFVEALATMDDPARFGKDAIAKLSDFGWSDADIFDALDHASFLFKFHKILEAYLR